MNDDDVSRPGSPDGKLPARLLALLKLNVPGYRLLEEIARGGQAVVYRAIQERTGRVVAVKLLHDGPLASEAARERLRRELHMLAAVDHPGVVSVIDSGETADGHEYLVMNYIAGKPLDLFMRAEFENDNPAERTDVLLRLFVKICHAVNAAHVNGITHRDLSPSNILIDERGDPHVLDFGLARTAFDRVIAQGGHEVSFAGQFLGKLAYASPEQTRGKSDAIDVRSDVYSLGVILYQMVGGGRFPYDVDGEVAHVLDEIVHTKPPAPSRVIRSGAGTGIRRSSTDHQWTVIDAIVLKSLEKAPDDRYQNALEFAREIESYLAGRPAAAGIAIRTPRGLARFDRRWGVRAFVGLIALLAIAGAFTYGPWFTGRRPHASEVEDAKKTSALPIGSPTAAPGGTIVRRTDRASRPLLSDSSAGARRIDLLKMVDPSRDARNHGVWSFNDGALICRAPKGNELEFPYAVPAEYDYRITFECDDAAPSNLQFFFPGDKRQIDWCVAVRDNTACGLDLIDGRDSAQNPTTRWAGKWTVRGRPQTFVAKVRKDHVEGYLNDALIGDYDTDYHEIGLREWLRWERPDTVGVMFNMPLVKILSAEVAEVTGKGKPLR